jgi:vacuolar-type H+-ATPase subunit E/Vma4
MQLAPLAAAIVARANDAANRLIADAEAAAQARTGEAQAQAERVLDDARRDGEAAAARAAAASLAEARRAAREFTLRAQSRAAAALRAAVQAELVRRRATPPVAGFLEALEADARRRLGSAAVVRRLEGDAFGIVAEDGRRRLEITADTLVDRAMDAMGAQVEALWQ